MSQIFVSVSLFFVTGVKNSVTDFCFRVTDFCDRFARLVEKIVGNKGFARLLEKIVGNKGFASKNNSNFNSYIIVKSVFLFE